MIKFVLFGFTCSTLLANALHHPLSLVQKEAQMNCFNPTYPYDCAHVFGFEDLRFPLQAKQPASGGRDNFCVEGHLFPELFILGMPKTATSTLSWDLHRMGIKGNGGIIKESKFFNEIAFNDSENLLTKPLDGLWKERWKKIHPLCSNLKRKVLAEFTPEYLMMTPIPPQYKNRNLTWMEKSYEFDFLYGFPTETNLPMVLSTLYGKALSPRLRFVVTIREPLSQLQSSYYFAPMVVGWEKKMKGVKMNKISPEQFEGDLERYINKSLMTPEISQLLYAKHLEGYLKYFHPQQFIMIPYRFVFHQNKKLREEVIDIIFTSLNLERVRVAHSEWRPHILKTVHPKTISPQLVANFQNLIYPENKKLFELLAAISMKGAKLALYDGAPGSEPEINAWLTSGW